MTLNPILMRIKLILLKVLIFILYSTTFAQQWTSGGEISEFQSGMEVTFYHINLNVDSSDSTIAGFADVHVRAKHDGMDVLEFDLIRNYRVTEVKGMGQELDFVHDNDKLLIELDGGLKAGEILPVRIFYDGRPHIAIRPPWDGGFNWSKDPDGNDWIGVSCQLEGGKMWFPAVDHPTVRADSAALSIRVPKPYFTASNGILEHIDDEEHHRTFHWKTRYPIHSYNLSINIARYEVFERTWQSSNGDSVPVVFYVLPQFREHADEILDMTILKLDLLESYYGPYGYTSEKFGLANTHYLGMEHQTINSYGNHFDFTTINGRSFDWLLLHELIHEWWGNLITVSDWADFWIHEGITTFTDARFLIDFVGQYSYHEKMADYRRRILNRQPIVPGENINTKEIYNHDVYYKAAYFMHTLSFVLGQKEFFSMLMDFALENRYGYTSTSAFREFLEDRSGMDLGGLFELYLYTTDLPSIKTEEVAEGEYEISIPNITFKTPMHVNTGDALLLLELGPEPVRVSATRKPIVDPNHWYLKAR